MTATELSSREPDASVLVDRQHPWPGLAAFRERDQGFFHGRGTETEEIHRLLRRARLTLLYGISGLGKTSLLRAGLFPRLRRDDYFPVYIRLDHGEEAAKLSDQVRAAIERQAQSPGQPEGLPVELPPFDDATLWESFHREAAEFWSGRNRLLVPVLVLDQFEELFTLGARSSRTVERGREFLLELGDLVEGRAPQALLERLAGDPTAGRSFVFGRHDYKIVLSFREEFLPELEGLRETLPSIAHNRFRLRRMSGASAEEAVLAAGGELIQPDVAEEVVRFVAAEKAEARQPLAELEVEPALLSVVCRELNNQRLQRGQRRITSDLLEGSRDEILSDFYERSLRGMTQSLRIFIEDELLTVSGFRDSVAWDNALDTAGVEEEDLRELVRRRLLRIEEGRGRRVELSHDLLTGVVQRSRERRRQHEEVEGAPMFAGEAATEPAAAPEAQFRDEWALCLSAGGYRAVMFHLGALWRLNDAGFLPRLDLLSGVSAGAMVAALIGGRWAEFDVDAATGRVRNFENLLAEPLRRLADKTLDTGLILSGVLRTKRPDRALARRYRKILFADLSLQQLPERPRIVLNAANFQTGAPWRFSRAYMGDWRTGRVLEPALGLAEAVAAATTIPGLSSPAVLETRHEDFRPDPTADLQRPPYTTGVQIVDGGILDSLAVDTAWKRSANVLVSDAGTRPRPEEEPASGVRGYARALELIAEGARNLRQRQLLSAYHAGVRGGAYWSIWRGGDDRRRDGDLPYSEDQIDELASIPGRLKRLEPVVQERLINWGYAACDAAVQRYLGPSLGAPPSLPYGPQP